MKKILAIVLALSTLAVFAACTAAPGNEDENNGVMTYEEYAAAELNAPVTVETYVQAKQSWWDNKATLYTQSEDGAYFIYEMPITEEEYQKLIPGTKLLVKGYKAEWSGEVEIVDAQYEILEGAFVAEAFDATDLLGKEELINHQNKFVSFKGMAVEKVEYKNGEPGDDIYVTLSKDGTSYDFCVEVYLTGTETEVYKSVGELAAGDVIDVEGFLYWYEGANTHITAISAANEAEVEPEVEAETETNTETEAENETKTDAAEETETKEETEVTLGDNEFTPNW